MKRPMRSFTVEVKRSRLRPDGSSITSAFNHREALSSASVASSLSWDELLRRLPENLAFNVDQPYITSWPGQEAEPSKEETAQTPAVVDATSPAISSAVPEQKVHKPRILPSLIPAEVPLDARKPAVYDQETPVLPTTRLPKQRSRLPTAELQAASAQNKRRRIQAAYESMVTVDELKKVVQTHLRDRTVQVSETMVTQAHEPVQKASASAPASLQEKKVLDVVLRKKTGRRRQDFWKHRLRSYAAK